MLGLMNSPTDGVEVYSASPRTKRLIFEESEATKDKAKSGGGQKSGSSSSTSSLSSNQAQKSQQQNPLEVFSESKVKPKISYTHDGRKLVDGKLSEKNAVAPDKLWNKLIVGSFAAKITSSNKKEGGSRKAPKKQPQKPSKEVQPVGGSQLPNNTQQQQSKAATKKVSTSTSEQNKKNLKK